MKIVKIGSRESRLAVLQSDMVISALEKAGVKTELVTMKTTGDIILDRTLDKIGGKGLFVRELDRALALGDVDVTVHSFKDLPMELAPGLPIVAASRREDPRDVLVLPSGVSEWDMSLPVGCASSRRRIQLKRLYPDIAVEPVRGNVQTRLQKLDSGKFGALILAAAGLRRLGLDGRISRFFTPEEMIPAAGQGVIAVQAREGENVSFLDGFNDKNALVCATAERAFVRALGGGCTSPVAAYATLEGDELTLTGLYADEEPGIFESGKITGPARQAEQLGESLAVRLRERV